MCRLSGAQLSDFCLFPSCLLWRYGRRMDRINPNQIRGLTRATRPPTTPLTLGTPQRTATTLTTGIRKIARLSVGSGNESQRDKQPGSSSQRGEGGWRWGRNAAHQRIACQFDLLSKLQQERKSMQSRKSVGTVNKIVCRGT